MESTTSISRKSEKKLVSSICLTSIGKLIIIFYLHFSVVRESSFFVSIKRVNWIAISENLSRNISIISINGLFLIVCGENANEIFKL